MNFFPSSETSTDCEAPSGSLNLVNPRCDSIDGTTPMRFGSSYLEDHPRYDPPSSPLRKNPQLLGVAVARHRSFHHGVTGCLVVKKPFRTIPKDSVLSCT